MPVNFLVFCIIHYIILLVNTFLFFILDICQPAINFGITRYISQNCGVSDCAVIAICQLVCYRIVFNSIVFDGYCSAHCLRLASLKKIISLHKNHLSDRWLFIPARSRFFPTLAYKSGNALKPLINQGFLDFVKGLFPLFPLFLKFLHERKHIHFITLNRLVYVCLYIRVIFFGGKIEKSGNIYYILVITSANHRHLYRHLVLRCLSDFCGCKPCWLSNLLFWPF